jgi:hypothetical protein
MTRDKEHRYPIKSHADYCFFAGTTTDNKQVLMGLFFPNLIAIFFDSDGKLMNIDKRSVEFSPLGIYDDRIEAHIESWQEEMCFQPTTVRVQRFFAQEPYIGIEDYPSHFAEILADPEKCNEEKNDIRESMRLWDEDGQFVLQWGNDYWLNDSGEIVAS